MLPRTWRAGRTELVIVSGCLVALGGNVGLIASTLLASPPNGWLVPISLATIVVALALFELALLARRRARTAKHFAIIGILASAIALLTIPGLIGGTIALAGSTLGVFATYEGLPEARRA